MRLPTSMRPTDEPHGASHNGLKIGEAQSVDACEFAAARESLTHRTQMGRVARGSDRTIDPHEASRHSPTTLSTICQLKQA
jgi:hypothetical protein